MVVEGGLVPLARAWYTGKRWCNAENRRREVRFVMASVLAFVDDLFFQAKILETAKRANVDVRTFTAVDALLAEIKRHAPKLVIVDLNTRSKPLEAIESVRSAAPDLPVIAFLSHVQAELAQRASAAGSSRVMPRSQFTRELATILAQAKSQS
jgi:DNA-binding NarL/FixJ family response regulator